MSRRRRLPPLAAARSAIIDSDVLIALRRKGMEESLSVLYSRIYVPAAVRREQRKGRARRRLNRLFQGGLYERCRAEDQTRADLLSLEGLGPGESEAIVQAQEMGVPVILTADRRARRFARLHGLRTFGFRDIESSLRTFLQP